MALDPVEGDLVAVKLGLQSFKAGEPSALRQFRFCQFSSHFFWMASTRYLESLVRVTAQGSFKASSPTMAAISSMRLLVVSLSPPESSFSVVPYFSTAP